VRHQLELELLTPALEKASKTDGTSENVSRLPSYERESRPNTWNAEVADSGERSRTRLLAIPLVCATDTISLRSMPRDIQLRVIKFASDSFLAPFASAQ
jgi:hypothetical protein